MFNKGFYPTPPNVVLEMTNGLSLNNKVILEPQCGKCDIVNIVCEYFTPAQVLACEIEPDLQSIINDNQHAQLIGADFFNLKKEDISHVDFIIMNPPFANGIDHLKHAWEIAPPGCTIVCLLNHANLTAKERIAKTRIINELIKDNGSKRNLGEVFKDAERKTKVQTALVTLNKEKAEGHDFEFEGYFDLDEEFQEVGSGHDVINYDFILDVVNRFTGAVKQFDEAIHAAAKINELTKDFHDDNRITFGAKTGSENKGIAIDRETFKKETQKAAWKYLFEKMNMRKYLTASAIAEINKLVELQQNVPFSRNNIYKMLQMIVGTNNDRMKKILIEVFDWLTSHHHDNRKGIKGWKTNSAYFVDKKFIAPDLGVCKGTNGEPNVRYYSTGTKFDELVKAMCNMEGENYDEFTELHSFFGGVEVPNEAYEEAVGKLTEYTGIDKKLSSYIHRYVICDHWPEHKMGELQLSKDSIDKVMTFYKENPQYKDYDCRKETYKVYKPWGKWLDWNKFFEIRVYKNGNFHARFKDDKVWERFNLLCAKAKGWGVPENVGSDVRRKKREDKSKMQTGVAVIK